MKRQNIKLLTAITAALFSTGALLFTLVALIQSTPLSETQIINNQNNQIFSNNNTTTSSKSIDTTPVIPEEPLTNTTDKYRPAVFASIPYWDQERAFLSFKEHVNQIDYVSLFWYNLRSNGSIATYQYAKEDESIIDYAKKNGVKTFVLIANLPDEDDGENWDSKRVERVIIDPEKRKNHINDIATLVERNDVDGVNIDYENLDDDLEPYFTQFINELSEALHDKGKIVAVALHPQQSNDDHTWAQNWKKLALSADQLIIMAYDEHWVEGDPGPIASYSWVKGTLEFARDLTIPMEKVLLGMPLFGNDWGGKRGGIGIEYEDAIRLAETYEVTPTFDEKTFSLYFTYRSQGRSHEVWFEDVRSFLKKLELANEFRVAGIALWRLGREDTRIWDYISVKVDR